MYGDKKKKKKNLKKREKFDYYEAFEEQIKISRETSSLLLKAVKNFSTAEELNGTLLPQAHALENAGDEVCHKIYDYLLPDFVTPIDREDIVSITSNIDLLTDKIEEVCRCFYMYDIHFMHNGVLPIVELINEAIDVLVHIVREFKNAKHSDCFIEGIIKVNDLEEKVDELYTIAIHNLYTHDRENPVRVLVWSNIFLLLEECADQTETVANLLRSVHMKNG